MCADARGAEKIAVVGGSLAGLLVALLLHRAGHRVDVYERAGAELASRGAGIVTHPPLFEAMRAGGVAAPSAIGVQCSGRVAFNREGDEVASVALEQTLTSWDLVYRLLLDALPVGSYHTGHAVNSIEPGPENVRLHIEGRPDATAQWVIGADGIRSVIRGAVAPQVQHEYAGYIAWRGLVDEAQLSASVRADLRERMAFSLPEGEQMLGYLVAGRDDALGEGQRRFNWVWYRPAPAGGKRGGLDDLLRGRDGRHSSMSIAPDQIRQPVLEAMREASQTLLSPQFAQAVQRTRQPLIQPIFDLLSTRLCFGRVLLIGDAAFVARPHVGMGVTKAAQDAMELATAFSVPVAERVAALASFEQSRLAAGRAVIQRARRLGAYLQAQQFSASERAAAQRNRSVEVILAETAAPQPVS